MRLFPKRKWIRRMLVGLCVSGAAGVIILLGLSSHVVSASKDRIISAEDAAGLGADCILVLGSFVYESTPGFLLEARLQKGLELYGLGASSKLLMSGDHGREGYDEVNTMKQYALEEGVLSQDIFMDHAGFSTYESVYRARDVFQAERIIIVTQEYHLYRSLYIAQELGLDCYGVASDPQTTSKQQSLREAFARAKDFIYAKLQPAPTYLGEAIPVSGNGDLTNG